MTPRPACRAAALSRVLSLVLHLALGAVLVLRAQGVHAAAVPVTTSPTRFAALIHAPRVIRLRFSEAIVKKFSGVFLTDLTGHEVRAEPVKVKENDSLEVRIGRLDAGVYMVHWTTVSAVDGSKASGRYQFTVQ